MHRHTCSCKYIAAPSKSCLARTARNNNNSNINSNNSSNSSNNSNNGYSSKGGAVGGGCSGWG